MWGRCASQILTQEKANHLGNTRLIRTAGGFDLSAFIALVESGLEIGADADQLPRADGFHSGPLGRLENRPGTIE